MSWIETIQKPWEMTVNWQTAKIQNERGLLRHSSTTRNEEKKTTFKSLRE